MLAYKAWRESRDRFLIGAIVVASSCLAFVVFADAFRAHVSATSYAGYIEVRVYGGVVRAFSMLVAVVLGLGGLHRERAHGSLGFTLALPVRRVDHVRARAIVGLAQLAALACLPVVIVPAASAIAGESFSVGVALEHALVWLVVGAAIAAASVVVSSIVANDYAAIVVAIVARKGIAYIEPHERGDVGSWLVVVAFAAGSVALLVIAEQLAIRERLS